MSSNYLESIGIKWDEITTPDEYPYNIPSISSFETMNFDRPITFFCGENGTGKSTLLEGISIAIGLNSEGGSRNYTFSVKETHSELFNYLALRRSTFRPKDSFFVRSDTMFNLISEIDNLEDNYKLYEGRSLHSRSHGESILTLVSRRFRDQGFYVLDEPETGLSQSGQVALLCEIVRLSKAGSQFIIATHSPILLSAPDCTIYQFDNSVCQIKFEDSLEWIVLRRFMDSPRRVLDEFMEL